MQGLKGTIFFCKQGQQILGPFLLLKNWLVFSSFLYFEMVWVFSAFRFNFLSFGCYSEYLFLEKVRAKYIFYFKLLRYSPIDQIVQTVFGYSLRKE